MPDAADMAVRGRLAALLDPVTPQRFLDEYLDRKPLHVRGTPERTADLMSWDRLEALLGMTSIWTPDTLRLMLDRQRVPAAEYCSPALVAGGQKALRPDPRKVQAWLRRGASVVCNDVDALGPALAETAAALEQATGGKVQANLYFSRREHQAFASHYDVHDVFAVHCEGEKSWRVYRTRADHPIAHPRFTGGDEAHHNEAKGAVLMELTLKPGDLLYLPRGQYHDALAASEGTVHLSFGVTRPIGLDALTLLWERAVDDPAFRRNLPRPDAPDLRQALKEHLAELGRRAAALATDPAVLEALERQLRQPGYARDRYDLSSLLAEGPAYEVAGTGFRLIEAEGGWRLAGPTGEARVPTSFRPLTAWALERRRFTRDELAAAFPELAASSLAKFLDQLTALKVLRQA